MENIPSRLTERSFRQYESTISQAIKAFPQVVTLYPKGNLNTYVARLRDAMLSLEKYGWTTSIDKEAFKEIRPRLVVALKDDAVFIGARAAIKDFKPAQPIQLDNVPTKEIEYCIVSLESLKVLCDLAAKRLLACNLRITQRFDTDLKRLVAELEDNFDVCITLHEDGTFTIS